jgi:hypothetical protein
MVGAAALGGVLTATASGATVTVPGMYGEIQQAIEDCVDGDIVVVSPGVYDELIDFKGKAITVRSVDPLDPSVVATTVIDGTGLDGSVVCFENGEGPNSVLSGFTITGGTGTDLGDGYRRGGGILIYLANPTVQHSVITLNSADYGGGMLIYTGDAEIGHCQFVNNTATHSGGGAYNSCCNVTMYECRFEANAAPYGAGLLNWESESIVACCEFIDNEAVADGGGMYNSLSSPEVSCTTFTGNSAEFGGGMFNSYGHPFVAQCQFLGNIAGTMPNPVLEPGGGGMYNWYAETTVDDCLFEANVGLWGGGMINEHATSTVSNSVFRENVADFDGGGMFNHGGNPVVTESQFLANTAEYGGGILTYDGCVTVTGTLFRENTALTSGGGVYNSCGTSIFSDSLFEQNTAAYGAGMVNWTGTPTIASCTFSNNWADEAGGGMYNSSASPEITSCVFDWNSGGATGFRYWEDGGGGMYNIDSSPVITLTAFNHNAGFYGGGMFNLFSSPTVLDNTFSFNQAVEDGGGMANFDGDPIVTNATFTGNMAGSEGRSADNGGQGRGGGMANYLTNLAVTDSTFKDNWAAFLGGGIFNEFSHPLVLNGRFIGNETWNLGGGVASLSSSPTILACTFTGEPGSNDYRLVDCAEPFEDISATGTIAPTASTHDNDGDDVQIGFTFKFYGVEHTEIGISSNGYLTFGDDLSAHNEPIPSGNEPNDLIAPYWDDWALHQIPSSNAVRYEVRGTAPYRRFIAQWTDVPYDVEPWDELSTFQAVLYETTNCIEFRYEALAFGSPALAGIENQDGSDGGAAGTPGSYSALAFSPKAINVNMAWGGGGLYSESGSPSIINTLFTDCEAYRGGAMAFYDASPIVTNVTAAENLANWGAAVDNYMANPILTNVILWNDPANEINDHLSTTIVTYSDVWGGFTGAGNIDLDPMFVSPCLDDFRLAAGSPAIDAGDTTALPPDVQQDLDGLQRFVDDPDTPDTGVGSPPVDMGAYEFQNAFCPADLDGDGMVGTTDLLAMLAAWGTPDADMNFDGTTDMQDLLILLGAWGSCPS